MNKPTKLNYEHTHSALNELKRNPNNLQAYNLAKTMAKREKSNIKFWESQINKWIELNNRLIVGQAFLENYCVLSFDYLDKCTKGFQALLRERKKLDADYQEYSKNLNLFTAYKAYSKNFEVSEPQPKPVYQLRLAA